MKKNMDKELYKKMKKDTEFVVAFQIMMSEMCEIQRHD